MTEKPKVTGAAQKEIDIAAKQFDAFDASVKEMTLDRMNAAPKLETEEQTKLSTKQIEKYPGIYLKPDKTVPCQDKFNFRAAWNFDKEYVHFTAENKEIIGETIELWTRPYGGVHAMFWKVPVNTPVWGPRYLAEQIQGRKYHRLTMQENRSAGSDGVASYHGAMAVDTTIQRLEARPVSTRKSVFMGANSF